MVYGLQLKDLIGLRELLSDNRSIYLTKCSVKYDLRHCHSALDAESISLESGFPLSRE
jgi:hypothetical protein